MLKFVRPVVKLKGTVVEAKAPPAVIERSIADISFIVGLLLDKFLYHLPLYRQHQRLLASGVHLNRHTLTNLVHRGAELLEPIYRAVQSSVLISHVLAMDETPVKAGRTERGVMHRGWLWALYGDKDEVAFLYSPSRSGELIRKKFSSFNGTLLTDGYKVYDTFAKQREEVVHAQCWVHTRRKFFEAQESEPELSGVALRLIGTLYEVESKYSRHERGKHGRPIVDEFFVWLKEIFQKRALLPSSPFTKAASYALQRESALRVFLQDEKVPLDTNQLVSRQKSSLTYN